MNKSEVMIDQFIYTEVYNIVANNRDSRQSRYAIALKPDYISSAAPL